MNRYIGTAHISNTGGIGILSICDQEDLVEYEVVSGDEVLRKEEAQLDEYKDEDGEYRLGFMDGEIVWFLDDFMGC